MAIRRRTDVANEHVVGLGSRRSRSVWAHRRTGTSLGRRGIPTRGAFRRLAVGPGRLRRRASPRVPTGPRLRAVLATGGGGGTGRATAVAPRPSIVHGRARTCQKSSTQASTQDRCDRRNLPPRNDLRPTTPGLSSRRSRVRVPPLPPFKPHVNPHWGAVYGVSRFRALTRANRRERSVPAHVLVRTRHPPRSTPDPRPFDAGSRNVPVTPCSSTS